MYRIAGQVVAAAGSVLYRYGKCRIGRYHIHRGQYHRVLLHRYIGGLFLSVLNILRITGALPVIKDHTLGCCRCGYPHLFTDRVVIDFVRSGFVRFQHSHATNAALGLGVNGGQGTVALLHNQVNLGLFLAGHIDFLVLHTLGVALNLPVVELLPLLVKQIAGNGHILALFVSTAAVAVLHHHLVAGFVCLFDGLIHRGQSHRVVIIKQRRVIICIVQLYRYTQGIRRCGSALYKSGTVVGGMVVLHRAQVTQLAIPLKHGRKAGQIAALQVIKAGAHYIGQQPRRLVSGRMGHSVQQNKMQLRIHGGQLVADHGKGLTGQHNVLGALVHSQFYILLHHIGGQVLVLL